MYLQATFLLLGLIWVAIENAQSQVVATEEDVFDCFKYLICKEPKESGQKSKFTEALALAEPKSRQFIFELIRNDPNAENTDEYWESEEAKKCTYGEGEDEFQRFVVLVQTIGDFWVGICVDKEDEQECKAVGAAFDKVADLVEEALAEGKCGGLT
ncbi:hypothetical protein JTE90_018697 [Oedothorax gibbosus]|uniref:Uncharacterized protein n=1 Tax=Oedothorax gibbosus TaxID=931172 RepID=A0AAV6TYY3_9ARAC|nr:hypothetical protein JTE90_018697 [Oedothorax gibbosus]